MRLCQWLSAFIDPNNGNGTEPMQTSIISGNVGRESTNNEESHNPSKNHKHIAPSSLFLYLNICQLMKLDTPTVPL